MSILEVLGFSTCCEWPIPLLFCAYCFYASPTPTPFGDSDFFDLKKRFVSCSRDDQQSSEVDPTYQDHEGDILLEKTMEVFMDDFSVFGDSFSTCLSHLEKMLKRCEDTNLSLNWEKSHFMVKEGIVLGHKISKSGIEVDRAKVEVIAKLPHPTTVKGVLISFPLGPPVIFTDDSLGLFKIAVCDSLLEKRLHFTSLKSV
ncbi:reverse transcriptase domain-containing protein [Tanacetum coccineum]|uniref:Reverse transcriptase domain-containing protein n=1 Tax=Tanacetum coccineum TaxID=301880 RepID=A0ABQ5G4V4_9ASTR